MRKVLGLSTTKKTLGAGIALCIALLGVPVVAGADSPPASAASQSFTGREILRGLMFGQGPVADLFPEITEILRSLEKRIPASERDRFHRAQDALLTKIDEAHPTFFETFRADMQSGDPLAIQAALRRMQRVVLSLAPLTQEEIEGYREEARNGTLARRARAAFEDLGGRGLPIPPNEETNGGGGTIDDVVAVDVVAVVVVGLVVFNVTATVIDVIPLTPLLGPRNSDLASTGSRLARDVIVDLIADRLAVEPR